MLGYYPKGLFYRNSMVLMFVPSIKALMRKRPKILKQSRVRKPKSKRVGEKN